MEFKEVKFAFVTVLVLSMLLPTSTGFTVKGAIFRADVSPGEEIFHEITVSIDEDASSKNMVVVVGGLAMSQSGANVLLDPEEDSGPYTARPFLTVSPDKFELQPGVPQKVILAGTVPEEIGYGGRYALVSIETVPDPKGNIVTTTAILVPVLLWIEGTENIETGEITDLAASKSDEGVEVDLIFENTGNYHYKPLVGAVLTNGDGEVLAEEEPKQIRSSILPTNSRLCEFALVPETKLASGTYTVEASVIHEDGTVLDKEETTFEV